MAWDVVQLLDHSFIAASECPMRANLPLSKYTFPSTIMYTRSFRNLDAIIFNGRDKRKGGLHVLVGIGIAKLHAVLPWRRANGNESHGHCCN